MAFHLPGQAVLGLPSPSPRVCTDGRTYADVRTKIFRINGLPNFLTYGAPRAPLNLFISCLDEGKTFFEREVQYPVLFGAKCDAVAHPGLSSRLKVCCCCCCCFFFWTFHGGPGIHFSKVSTLLQFEQKNLKRSDGNAHAKKCI